MRFSMLMWAALTVVVGISLFLLKYQVQELEDQLQATYVQIEKDKSAIRVLQAEWTYLNDPTRLRRLSEQHLGFGAPSAKQVATLAQLPYRDGRAPASEGASAPTPPLTVPKQTAGVRTTMVTPTAFTTLENAQPSALFLTAAAPPHRPSAIAAIVARLQRMLGPTWSGANLFQEPQR
jgi:cell division protein FtsL